MNKKIPISFRFKGLLRGHFDRIYRLAWSPDGIILATPSRDYSVRLWKAETGDLLYSINEHSHVNCVAWSPDGSRLAIGADNNIIQIWDINNRCEILRMNGVFGNVWGLSWSPDGQLLASATDDSLLIWHIGTGELYYSINKDKFRGMARCVAWSPDGNTLAAGCENRVVLLDSTTHKAEILSVDNSDIKTISWFPDGKRIAWGADKSIIKIWDIANNRQQAILEGHNDSVICISISHDGNLLASKSIDDSVRLWRCDTFETVAVLEELSSPKWPPGIAFHPKKDILATLGEFDTVVRIWELNLEDLLDRKSAIGSIRYVSAKIVLVGDTGVGKTGLGWRLAHGKFKEHSSTHGQQFWLLNQLCKKRCDGAQCEAVLWDLAGQEDYRLIHALFLDDADLALVLFDPTHNVDPLSGVEFWLKQLKVEAHPPSGTPTMLIAARSDRGAPRLTQEELDAFCKLRGIKAYLPTSAKEGEGIEELIQQMQDLIPWNEKPATITTETFKRIKDFLLNLKEDSRRVEVILTSRELRQRLEKSDRMWNFSDAEMLTAVGHLANHGYVTRLKTSQGEQRILLAPELLNNLASSFVLEARRNQKGLGSLEEQRLLSGGYKFSELEKLTEAEKDILLDSAVVLFLEHNVCFRETDPLNGRAYLVFPELINLKKPMIGNDTPTEDGVAYTVSGAVENVYASLVVLMGYTQTFTRTNQWRDHARYEVGTGHVCGFRLEARRAGELDLVLYFGTNTPAPVRTLFQSLFENFLARRNLMVRRFEPVICSKGHPLNRAVVRQKMSNGVEFVFCSDCGEKIMLPKADQPIHLTKQQAEEVEANHLAADQRSRFEQALFRLKNYVTDQKIAVPECFISYAWGDPVHEHWVERSLATDLQKAGITVVLDRWHNPPGSSIGRFIDRLEKVDRIIAVGTIAYRKKYDNEDPEKGTVVAAECAQINTRMRGVEKSKATIIPVLLEGTAAKSFPPCLSDQVFSDFRKPEAYFDKALELILSLYQIPPQHPVATELSESLVGQKEF